MGYLPARQILPRSRNVSLLLCMAKLLDQLRWRHRSLKLPTLLKNAGSPTFEQTGDPLLLIGRDSSRLRQRDRQVFFDMRSFQ